MNHSSGSMIPRGSMTHADGPDLRLGVDLGLSRIRGIVLEAGGRVMAERRIDTPDRRYRDLIAGVVELIGALERDVGQDELSVGLATPSSLNPSSHRMQPGHMALLNERPLATDLAAMIGREVRVGHAAGCLGLAESRDGAAAGAGHVFATSIGSGVTGALVFGGALVGGPGGAAGAWSHTSLPWPNNAETRAAPECWCGHAGCIHAWVSGPGMSADHVRRGGHSLTVEQIVARAEGGERLAGITLRDWLTRVARGFAMVINIVEPEVIVVGGGLSRIRWLYSEVPKIWGQYCVTDQVGAELVPAAHGEISVARGAACLWP